MIEYSMGKEVSIFSRHAGQEAWITIDSTEYFGSIYRCCENLEILFSAVGDKRWECAQVLSREDMINATEGF